MENDEIKAFRKKRDFQFSTFAQAIKILITCNAVDYLD